MGRLYRNNYKIWTGKTPLPADETGEVLTFPEKGTLASGDIVGGLGVSVVASGTPGSEVVVISTAGGGLGASGVSGPAFSTDNAIALWDGTSGDLLQNSNITADPATGIVSIGGIVNNGRVINNVTLFGSSPASASSNDYFCILNAVGIFSFTLSTSPSVGSIIIVKDGVGDAATFAKTIFPATGTIDGQSSVQIAGDYGSLGFIYNGSEWNTI